MSHWKVNNLAIHSKRHHQRKERSHQGYRAVSRAGHRCQALPATLIQQVGLAPQAPIVQRKCYVLSVSKGTGKSPYPQSHCLCVSTRAFKGTRFVSE